MLSFIRSHLLTTKIAGLCWSRMYSVSFLSTCEMRTRGSKNISTTSARRIDRSARASE